MNPFPRFIFAFGASDEFVNAFLDLAPEAIWIDLGDLFKVIDSDLHLEVGETVAALRKSKPSHIGDLARAIYRQDFEGDANDVQVIITGPIAPQDVFAFSRVYGISTCLCININDDYTREVKIPPLDVLTEFNQIRIIHLAPDKIDVQIALLELEWTKLNA